VLSVLIDCEMKETAVHSPFVTSHVYVIGFLNSFSVFCCHY
jgi:hypothetical protein